MGLILVFVPSGALPWTEPDSRGARMTKHVLGLVLFATGTIGIHQKIRTEVGNEFLVWSLIGLMVLSLVKVWWETRD